MVQVTEDEVVIDVSIERGVLIGIPIGITLWNTVGYIARVDGISMQPTLNPDLRHPDFVFLSRWAIRNQTIQRGEIVSVRSPKDQNHILIKRVIGLAGDIVYSHGYRLTVVEVPSGHCWLEGDHIGHSLDSNSFGPVSLGLITAKALCIVWPPSRWRAVSFVKRLHWDLPGTVCRHGLTIGDVDNDGDNELVVGTAEGELYIFKGTELWQKITGLGLVTSVAVGDIFNYGRNALVVICGDGWAHIFYSPRSVNPSNMSTLSTQQTSSKESNEQENSKVHTSVDIGTGVNMTNSPSSDQVDSNTGEINELSGKMECVHIQRIPTNTKVVLVADVDRDGANEMILGLTDRVVRSYRWSSNADLGTGKLVGLNKWECANQIGTVTLQHTRDGTPTLLVAQPGGTFMRIKCNAEDCHLEDESSCEANSEAAASCVDYQTLGISRMRNQNISTEIVGDLRSEVLSFASTESKLPNYLPKETLSKQSFVDDNQPDLKTFESVSLEFKRNCSQPEMRKNSFNDISSTDQVDGNFLGGNVILGECDSTMEREKDSVLPMFKDFSNNNKSNNNDANNNKNNNESNTEMQKDDEKDTTYGGKEENSSRGKPYALATLDGTIMLVKDEVILWAMQVDHQIFALCRLDVTGNGSDEIVACAWDGQTYILDQQRNSVRFQFEEPVRAFCTGNYNVSPGTSTPCLVYNTFHNRIFLYYDVKLTSVVISPLNPLEDLDPEEKVVLDQLSEGCSDTEEQQRMQQLTEWLLYKVG